MRLRRMTLIHIIALIIYTPTTWADSEIDTKIAKSFVVNWDSIQYNQTLSNPAIASNNSLPKESLLLSCQIEILDPNKTLGICRNGVITELNVGKDRKINIHRYTPNKIG